MDVFDGRWLRIVHSLHATAMDVELYGLGLGAIAHQVGATGTIRITAALSKKLSRWPQRDRQRGFR